MYVLQLEHVCFSYGRKTVLNDLNYVFEPGKVYALVGRSGVGKTTLLSLLSGLADPTSGAVLYNGEDIRHSDKYLYRSRRVGVIFQSYNLLPNLSARENVALSMDIAGVKEKDKAGHATELLSRVGLEEDEQKRRVLKLSGGQQQRVAIARALSYDPAVILADEPTGNLDDETEDEIFQIFRSLADSGKCVILVTHSKELSTRADVVYEMKKEPSAEKPKPTAPRNRKPLPPEPPQASTLGL